MKREVNKKPLKGSEKNAMTVLSHIQKEVNKLKTNFNELKLIVETTPNDTELGAKIRKYYTKK